MKLSKIGFRFSDNDFGKTCKLFMYLVVRDRWPVQEITKDYLEKLWRETCWSVYLFAQGYVENIPSERERITKYLTHPFEEGVKTTQGFYLNEEVDAYLNSLPDGWDNGEFHVVDVTTHGDTPYTYSV